MGSHIDVLLITLFFKHFRPLIEAGRVYLASPPLYRLEKKGKVTDVRYVADDKELAAIDTTGYNITRFKGLGEMSSDQMYETVMNKDTRTLKQVTISDAKKAQKVIEDLMGKNVAPRKKFITENAWRAQITI